MRNTKEIAVSLFRNGTRETALRFQVSLPALDRHKSICPAPSSRYGDCSRLCAECYDQLRAAWEHVFEQRDELVVLDGNGNRVV